MLQYGLAFGNKWKENGWLAGYIGRYCKLRTNLGMTYSCVCMNADNAH